MEKDFAKFAPHHLRGRTWWYFFNVLHLVHVRGRSRSRGTVGRYTVEWSTNHARWAQRHRPQRSAALWEARSLRRRATRISANYARLGSPLPLMSSTPPPPPRSPRLRSADRVPYLTRDITDNSWI